jgi:hypothetical protein
MRTFTAAQLARLLAQGHDSKLCLKIARDVEADLLFCSGADPVTVSSEDYDPREMDFDAFALGDPRETGQRITLDDADRVVRTAWYAERFSMKLATVTLLLRLREERPWTSVYSVAWYVRYGEYSGPDFNIELHSAVGTRPRAGLATGNRGLFPYAPQPGQSVRVGGYFANFGGGGGGGTPPDTGSDWTPTPWGT